MDEKDNSCGMLPFTFVDQIFTLLDNIQTQNRVIMEMINDRQVAEMSTEYLDLEQAQKVLHCKAKTLERLRMQGFLAYHQYGRKILVRRSDIDAFLEIHRRNPDFLERITEGRLPLKYESETESEEGGEK